MSDQSSPATPKQDAASHPLKKDKSQSSSPKSLRPPLPPRPSALSLSSSRPTTSHGSNAVSNLRSVSTTATTNTDISTYATRDGSRLFQATAPKRNASNASIARFGSGRTSDVGDDNASIMSYTPNVTSNQDVESLFGDGLGDGQEAESSSTLMTDVKTAHTLDDDTDLSEEFADIVGDDQSDEALNAWRAKKKHFIILSAAGKPIYTRHGSYNIISSYVGIIQTIISFYQSASDPLRTFAAGGSRFVVLSQNNLFLVAISSLLESEAQLRVQLEALYMQILSTLTLPTLTHIFSVRPSTDLRRPLEGTEVLLSSLADSFTRGSPSTLLSALECLKIRKAHRTIINSTLIKSRVDELLYGLIVAGGRLVSVIRPKKHSLHPSDLQLLFNMLFEAEGIKAGGGESWIPVCLPGFNNKGYLYMYVSFLDLSGPDTESVHEINPDDPQIAKEDTVAIILLSAQKDAFERLSSMESYLVRELHRNRMLKVIQSAIHAGRPTPSDIAPGSPLRHFLYKSKGNVQFVQPSLAGDLSSPNARRALFGIYHGLHASVHAKYAAVKVHHGLSARAASLAWVTPMFELYCVTGPRTGRNALVVAANRVVQWVQREEERLFIIGGAVF